MAETAFNLSPHKNVSNRRGQPIIFLGVIVGVWTLGRFISHAPDVDPADIRPTITDYSAAEIPIVDAPNLTEDQETTEPVKDWPPFFVSYRQFTKLAVFVPPAAHSPWLAAPNRTPVPLPDSRLSADGGLPIYPEISSNFFDPVGASKGQPTATPVSDRREPTLGQGHWSLQSWALVRAGGDSTIAAGNGQYGGSQFGAVARYVLKPGDARRAELYVRISSALPSNTNGGFYDAELAFGISGRPVKTVPVAVAVEQRVAVGKNARTRPTGYAVTQIPPFNLPANVSGSFYAQAGAVGIKDTQYFYDAQLLAEKPVVKIGTAKISVGGGLWSGGQTGQNDQEADIYRVDIGPRISAAVPFGSSNARLSLDYRARIAGNADPGSGLALTLSTDF